MPTFARGFSLLELLVALLVMSFGAFACLKLLALSAQQSERLLKRTVAETALISAYNIIQAQQSSRIPHWERQLRTLIPYAKVNISQGALSIQWQQSQAKLRY